MTQHNDTHLPSDPILVVGATGKTGRRVADRLRHDRHDVREASRTSPVRFDWTDRATWAPALAGVHGVYVTYQPDLIASGSGDDITEFVRLAADAGVARLVLLSGRGEDAARAAEEIVHASALQTTALSCSWFAQNFTEGAFASEIAELGTLTVPVGDVGEPFIDVDDIAAVAHAILTHDEGAENPHAGQTYSLTGPRLLTFGDAAAGIGAARGEPVAYQRVTADEYRAILHAAGVPDAEAAIFHELFGTLFDGRNESVSGDVERVLGRPATDFADVVARTYAPAARG